MARPFHSQRRNDGHGGLPATGASLFAHLYGDLYRLARRLCRSAHSPFSPTALVHEAYLHLAPLDAHRVTSRKHFIRLVARAMRQVLARAARRQRAQKRGANREIVSLSEVEVGRDDLVTLRLSLDQALETLRRRMPRPGRVAACRLYDGLSVEEIARTLSISPAAVKRDWRAARDWLRSYLRPPSGTRTGPPTKKATGPRREPAASLRATRASVKPPLRRPS